MRFFPRLRRRGGAAPAPIGDHLGCMLCGTWSPKLNGAADGFDWMIDHQCPPPVEILAVLHGGPCDGCAVTLHDPQPHDTVRIEDDEDPSQPDAVYVPRPGQDDPDFWHFDYAPEQT